MLIAKNGNHWSQFFNVVGMTRPPTFKVSTLPLG